MKRNIFKILLVEDNKTTSGFIIDFFSKMEDITIYDAGSITDATAIFNKFCSVIDLFLIDLYHPDGNGLDFLKSVRKRLNSLNITKYPPAIIVSSYITDKVRARGNQLGVVAYIEKPFDLNALSQKVNRALGTNHSNMNYEKANAN